MAKRRKNKIKKLIRRTREKKYRIKKKSQISYNQNSREDISTLFIRKQIEPNFNRNLLKELKNSLSILLRKTCINSIHSSSLNAVDKAMSDKARIDLSQLYTITIDGENAKDFDDAISLQYTDKKYFLKVHVADVSYFVLQDTLLDQEAYKRSTSTYLIDQVVPMLPEELSNDICSLIQGKKRYTLTCDMQLNHQGELVQYKFYKSIIENNRRCNYKEIQTILDNNNQCGKDLYHLISISNELKNILKEKRISEGSVNIESRESFFVTNDQGDITDIVGKQQLMSEQIIEEFMLLANQCAADFLLKHKTGIFRIHQTPSQEKLIHLINYIKQNKINVKLNNQNYQIGSKKRNPFQILLEKIKVKSLKSVFSYLILRSMMQAHYSEKNEGHYGLGFKKYTHFTSPIRRYPDLVVHRIISNILSKKPLPYTQKQINQIALHSSIREREAQEAEFEYQKIKAIRYFNQHLNEKKTGVITHITDRGFFVKEDISGIEGFVESSLLGYDAKYDIGSNEMKAVGEIYKIGQKIKIRILNVNPKKLFIDFQPIWS